MLVLSIVPSSTDISRAAPKASHMSPPSPPADGDFGLEKCGKTMKQAEKAKTSWFGKIQISDYSNLWQVWGLPVPHVRRMNVVDPILGGTC